MPVNPNAPIQITAFDWVPDFARGFVRDLRPRWACEEMGIDYAEHLISAVNRPPEHYRDQPWGQVPVLRDGEVRLFESGAILLHLAEKDEALLPRDPQGRATVISWLFAAYNSVEPLMFELSNVDLFAAVLVGVAACTTTALGAWLATLVDPFVGNVLFAAFLTFIAAQMAVRAVRGRRRS